MMKLKNSIGILACIAAISLISLAFLMMSQSVAVSATLVQLSILNFAVLLALSGLFVLRQFCSPSPILKKSLIGFAIGLMCFAGLAAFNIVDIQSTWNILIALAVLYITIIQMQLLNWNKSQQILKFIGLITLVANLYIFTFFIFKIDSPGAGFILDIAALASIISFLIGLVLIRKKNTELA